MFFPLTSIFPERRKRKIYHRPILNEEFQNKHKLNETIIQVGDICFKIFFDSGFKPIRDSYVTPIHNHTMLELHALHKGCVLLETDNTSYIMNPGDMILIGKQVYHHIPSTYGDTLKFTLKFSYSYSPGGFLEENEKQLFRYFDAHVRNPDYTEIFLKCTDVERIFNDLFSLTEKNHF